MKKLFNICKIKILFLVYKHQLEKKSIYNTISAQLISMRSFVKKIASDIALTPKDRKS
ncbi:hypothetical protein Fmac_004179 [Flemingia macrophylla]|uniref:Uncharacterized protein n=1 Tax=Flemingia macrophylla TaxID=520843 RepID=A0ABD1N486_9FABA